MSLDQFGPLYEQPYDEFLLEESSRYRLSRALYLSQDGSFRPVILSALRSLDSAALLENEIAYNPAASELGWRRKNTDETRSLVTNVFHEQSHRLLWQYLWSSRLACPS